MTDKEKYRDIPGYEGLYLISDKGTIVSYIASNKKPIVRRHNIKASGEGQHYIVLSKDKHIKRFNVAKLMALAFNLPNPNHYKYVLPKDGNPDNLDIDNLEWVKCHNKTAHTPEAEAKRAKTWEEKIENGFHRRAHAYEKLNHKVSAYDDDNMWVATFKSLAVAAKLTGANNIGQALRVGCRSGGYYWRYAERDIILEGETNDNR